MDWDNYYTIEFKGSKGWEVIWSSSKQEGFSKAYEEFRRRVINNDGQYRFTTPV